MTLAVIGGTGFRELVGLERAAARDVANDYGSVLMHSGSIGGVPLLFVSRHGTPASVPPHKVNYRAIIQALCDCGATGVIGIYAVGSIDPALSVPEIVFQDEVIDYTWGREHTFFDNEIHHIEFTWPYDVDLRARLIAAATALREGDSEVRFRERGVYGCTQGPRLESAAEIRRLATDGCHIVGMTGMPEVALARERGLPYAGLSVVVNAGAGLGGKPVDLAGMQAALTLGMSWARSIIVAAVAPPAART